jgi:hypothetical protein
MPNIYNLFRFLEDKEGTKTPLMAKLIHAPDTLTPDDLKIKGSLNLMNTKITSLPSDLKVDGNLDLSNTPIISLPDGLKVGGYLNLYNTKITSLPDGLKVGGSLSLSNTPLSNQYREKEIRKMIEDKGGNIEHNIYI